MPTHKDIHIAKSHKADLTSQNLSISMSLPTLTKRKYDTTTKAIRNAGNMLNMNIVAINKISGKLKVWCFKNPHYA